MSMLGCLLLAGCYAAPEFGVHDTWLTRAGHVFASDFSVAGWKHRSDGFARAVAAVPGEVDRVQRLEPLATAIAHSTVQRAVLVPQHAMTLVTTEAARPAHLRSPDFTRLGPDRIAHDVAEALAGVPMLLGFDRRPLGEWDDREHRTDPHDDRPEATLWRRVARRLGQ